MAVDGTLGGVAAGSPPVGRSRLQHSRNGAVFPCFSATTAALAGCLTTASTSRNCGRSLDA
jgi:hypothetical protein